MGRGVLTALAVLGILLAVWVIVLLKPVVIILLISIVLATGLAPLIVRLEKRRVSKGHYLPRGMAILIIYIAALLVLAGAATVVVVPVVRESIKFSQNLPEYIQATKDWLADMHQRHPYVPDYAGIIDRARSQLDDAGKYALSSVGAAFGVFGGVISVISVLVVTFYLLSTYEGIRKSFLSMVPPEHEKKIGETLTKMAAAMGGWLRGQLALAGIVGAITAAGMLILGVDYPFVIAVVGAIGELVPMLGPVAAAVPAVLISLFLEPTWKLVVCVLFFGALAQFENIYLAPRVMKSHVGLSPIVTILSLLAGGTLFGVVGALLAVPFAAALQVLFVEIVAPAIRASNGRRDKKE